MIEVIGVKFRFAGRLYYFGPAGIKFERGENVIVETARGREMGRVVMENREVDDEEVVQPLKEVIRKATDEDIMSAADNQAREADAFVRCKEKIKERELDMKLIQAEYTFDGSKVIFYFTSDKRVDFRELVKDLASMFKTRIELRQVGVRDETMIMGGIGVCGRPLCCKCYLNDFVPVSIKMAKEQSLSLNPTKISGVCGRLMCCLNNEEETYEYLNSNLPRIGETVTDKFEGITGTVVELNVLRQKVKVRFEKEDDTSEIKEFPVAELEFKGKKLQEVIEEEEEAPEELAILEELDEQDEERAEAEEPSARRRDRRNRGRNGRQKHNENHNEHRNNHGDRKNHNHGEDHGDNHGENRSEKHNENHGENRGEKHGENRGENRSEKHMENHSENRGEKQSENSDARRSHHGHRRFNRGGHGKQDQQ